MKGFKWLFFDLFDTVIFVDEEIYYEGKREAADIVGIDHDLFLSAWKDTSDDAIVGRLRDPFQRATAALKAIGIDDRAIWAKIAMSDVETLQKCVSFYDGAPEALPILHERFPLYIVSATPQDELIRIVSARGLSHWFRGILGSPQQKSEHIHEIIRTTGTSRENIIFVGDAINDWKAATSCGVRFVARIKPGEPDAFSGCPHIEHRVADMQELREYLDGIPC